MMTSKEIAETVVFRCDECNKLARQTYTVTVESVSWRYNDKSETRKTEARDVCLPCLSKAGVVSWIKVDYPPQPRWWQKWLPRS